jgi:hypothetical protein
MPDFVESLDQSARRGCSVGRSATGTPARGVFTQALDCYASFEQLSRLRPTTEYVARARQQNAALQRESPAPGDGAVMNGAAEVVGWRLGSTLEYPDGNKNSCASTSSGYGSPTAVLRILTLGPGYCPTLVKIVASPALTRRLLHDRGDSSHSHALPQKQVPASKREHNGASPAEVGTGAAQVALTTYAVVDNRITRSCCARYNRPVAYRVARLVR